MNNIRITEVAIQKLKIITTTNNKLDQMTNKIKKAKKITSQS